MSLLVSPVWCCAGMRTDKKKSNDLKRDGLGLPKEFQGNCSIVIVELYVFFIVGRRVFLLATAGCSK